MNTPNKVLMQQARETLKGKWKLAVKTNLVFIIISIIAASIPVLKFLSTFIITPPLLLGFSLFWISFSRNQNPNLDQVFKGFDEWWRSVKAYILRAVFILLWTFVFIIPGIIAAFSYAMTFYILVDDKEIGVNDAIEKSKKMMYGYKWKLFRLELRFIGWSLLCILTLGIGFLWLIPYMQVAMVKFYDDVKNNSTAEEAKIPEVVAVPVA